MNWNTSGLILEGIPATGKTTLLRALQRDERFAGRSYPSVFVLSEHHTQRVLEPKEHAEGLINTDNVGLLESHLAYLETLAERLHKMPWLDDGRTNMRLPFIFERFHLTHACHYNHTAWPDFDDIDRRLAALNGRIVLLTMDEADMRKRIIHDRDDGWRGYLSRFGKNDDEILAHYRRQQDAFMECCEKSHMNSCTIHTSGADIPESLRNVFDFWDLSDG